MPILLRAGLDLITQQSKGMDSRGSIFGEVTRSIGEMRQAPERLRKPPNNVGAQIWEHSFCAKNASIGKGKDKKSAQICFLVKGANEVPIVRFTLYVCKKNCTGKLKLVVRR